MLIKVFGTKWSLAHTYYPLYKNKSVFQTKCNRNVFKKRGENRKLTFLYQTSCKRITSKARSTRTDWIVIHNLTASIDATSARTRVHTLLVDTCFVLRTFCAHNTFRFATWRCSYIISLTWANCMTIHHTALAEWPTWRRLAWILCRWLCWCYKKMKWQ